MTDKAQGSIREAFENAVALLKAGRTEQAQEQLQAILELDPDEVNALRLLGELRLQGGDKSGGLLLLERAVAKAPAFDHATLSLARAYLAGDQTADAASVLEAFCSQKGDSMLVWQMLAGVQYQLGHDDDARAAVRRSVDCDPFRDRIRQAIDHAQNGQGRETEAIYRDILKTYPDHVHALVGLANIAIDRSVLDDAERLLGHALDVAPHLSHIHRALARLHMSRSQYEPALEAGRRAVELNPDLADSWTTLGTVQAWGLKQAEAAKAFKHALEVRDDQPRVWLSLGHVSKAAGHREDSVSAYRRSIELDPGLGEAWWSLADLKTYRFGDEDVRTMQRTLADKKMAERDQAALHFALGKAFEDSDEIDPSFEHYRQGNALRHRHEQFNIHRFERQCDNLIDFFSADRLDQLAGSDNTPDTSAPVPIFVIGLPRSGSTLVDQILSSHSQVQGTMELPHILGYVREMAGSSDDDAASNYPSCLAGMSRSDFTALGHRYLEETASYHLGAPYFVDKMPNNFMHVGLIRCMLPNALFVDTRRHPMACCFSIFKQNFARGQTFGYSLESLAAYYRGYVRVMSHWQSVLPGKVHRVIYEDMVDDPDNEIRTLLKHCDLPFEGACLRFHENPRVVRTASAEQVRQPMYGSSRDQWQRFLPQLDELSDHLGQLTKTWYL